MTKMDINTLQSMVAYILENQNNLEKVISDFGEVKSDNGYGTIFLSPKNPLFKVFWIHQQGGEIKSIGLGGAHLGFTVKDLYNYYKEYKESFSRHDDEYVYVFYSPNHSTHTIKISSSNKLIEGENIIDNKDVNGIEIILRNEQ